MTSSGKAMSISQTKPILIIKLIRPRVRSFSGKVMASRIGFKKKLTPPRKVPIRTKIFQSPNIWTPGTYLSASQRPAIDPAILRSRFHMLRHHSKRKRGGQLWRGNDFRLKELI